MASSRGRRRQCLLLLAMVAGSAVQAANICFLPNGRQVQDVPCDPTAKVSMCCGSKAACLSNGLCKDESTTSNNGTAYARGTCTDPTFQDPVCPQQCQLNQDTVKTATAYDFRANGVQMWQCDGQGFGVVGARYCCESAAEKSRCCQTPTAVFRLNSATPGNALAIQTFPPPMGVASSATSSSSTTPTATTTSAAQNDQKQQPSPPDTGLPTSTKLAASSTAAPDDSGSGGLRDAIEGNSGDKQLSQSGMVAVGVGAGVGGAALASLIGLLVVRHIRQQKKANNGSFQSLSSISNNNNGSNNGSSNGSNNGSSNGSNYGGGTYGGTTINTHNTPKGASLFLYGSPAPPYGKPAMRKQGMTLDTAELDSTGSSIHEKMSPSEMSETSTAAGSPAVMLPKRPLHPFQRRTQIYEMP